MMYVLARPSTSDGPPSVPPWQASVPRASTAEGGRRLGGPRQQQQPAGVGCRVGIGALRGEGPRRAVRHSVGLLPPASSSRRRASHGSESAAFGAEPQLQPESLSRSPLLSSRPLEAACAAMASEPLSFSRQDPVDGWEPGRSRNSGCFDDSPHHTRRMMKERDLWRVERDAFEKSRRRLAGQLLDMTKAHRETKGRLDDCERQNAALTDALADKSDALRRSEETSATLTSRVGVLEEELAALRAVKKKTAVLRDSDLLRQVRSAEQRIREAELRCGSADLADGGATFEPLLTEEFLAEFTVKRPLRASEAAQAAPSSPGVNGKEWLQEPPAWR
ncbi:hypothetical protein DIPPA_09767 [Diplonema papillatum]|nr:hypothetical protein DIPPA_09767 [Diplonema papillatum]KAJ9466015.1 hypothetical protein DIPPA_09767 [Diplonema papillatum]